MGRPSADPATCLFRGCGRRVKTLGMCAGHYAQFRRGGALTPLRLPHGAVPAWRALMSEFARRAAELPGEEVVELRREVAAWLRGMT